MKNKNLRERNIENHLRHYNTYKVGIANCERQLNYIMPNITTKFDYIKGSTFYISNNTERVAIDRIESKRALDLHEQITRYQLIVDSIDRAIGELKAQEIDFVNLRYFNRMEIDEVKKILGYREDKSVYRIRRRVLDQLEISLKNLMEG